MRQWCGRCALYQNALWWELLLCMFVWTCNPQLADLCWYLRDSTIVGRASATVPARDGGRVPFLPSMAAAPLSTSPSSSEPSTETPVSPQVVQQSGRKLYRSERVSLYYLLEKVVTVQHINLAMPTRAASCVCASNSVHLGQSVL